jgi:hypothetical protein
MQFRGEIPLCSSKGFMIFSSISSRASRMILFLFLFLPGLLLLGMMHMCTSNAVEDYTAYEELFFYVPIYHLSSLHSFTQKLFLLFIFNLLFCY